VLDVFVLQQQKFMAEPLPPEGRLHFRIDLERTMDLSAEQIGSWVIGYWESDSVPGYAGVLSERSGYGPSAG
jgi:hypothetical protein